MSKSKPEVVYYAPLELLSLIKQYINLEPIVLDIKGNLFLGFIYIGCNRKDDSRSLFITTENRTLVFTSIILMDSEVKLISNNDQNTIILDEWRVGDTVKYTGENLCALLKLLQTFTQSFQKAEAGRAARYVSVLSYLDPISTFIYSIIPNVPVTTMEIKVIGYPDSESLVDAIESLSYSTSKPKRVK